MKGKMGDNQRIGHILDSIKIIETFISGVDYNEYENDLKLRLAVSKLLENIGEAASQISEETKNKYPDIEWQKIKGFRNVLAHEYFGVDYVIIWNLLHKRIPELKSQIQNIYDSFD